MIRQIALFFVLFAPFGLAALAGPVALIAGTKSVDAQGIYLAVSPNPQRALDALAPMGVTPVGPDMAPFARFVEAGPVSLDRARQAGFMLITASRLALICGLSSWGESV